MNKRISSALKHLVLAAALRGLPQRKRKASFEAPNPLRQPCELPNAEEHDAWMFDRAAASATEHRMEMLANEMDRLSGTLGKLRAFLGSVAVNAPMLAAEEAAPRISPMIADSDLFDGEPLTATPNSIPAAGEAGYLFEEDSVAQGPILHAEPRAHAA